MLVRIVVLPEIDTVEQRETIADLVPLECAVVVTVPVAHTDCESERIALADDDRHIDGVELAHMSALPEIVTVGEREANADLVSLECAVIVTVSVAHADCVGERIAVTDDERHTDEVDVAHMSALPEMVTVEEREVNADLVSLE